MPAPRMAATLVFALVAALAACSDDPPPPPAPAAAADALVRGLVTGHTDDLSVIDAAAMPVNDVAARWATITGDLPFPPPSVVIRGVVPDPTDATMAVVDYEVRWIIDGSDAAAPVWGGDDAATPPASTWTYQTSAALRLIDDRWNVVYDPSTVEPSLPDGETLAITDSGTAPERGRLLDAAGEPLPAEGVAETLLGETGPATAELIEESGGRIHAEDVTGRSGMQRQYDARLSGTRARQIVARDAAGAERVLHEIPGVPARDVQLTIDSRAQEAAVIALSGISTPSSLVAIRPSDGHVVAIANGVGSGASDTARFGRLPPGSTFKVVSALGMLRTGLQLQSPVDCPPTITVGREFSNHSGYPSSLETTIPLITAVANSCNTAIIAQAGQVTPEVIATAAASLGIGEMPDLGADGYAGSIPVDAGTTEHAAQMIGQGRIVVSPLNMAAVAASVASGGRVSPILVRPDHQEGAGAAATPRATTPLTSNEAAALREIMLEVVRDGTATLLADVPGEPVGAKTGTAEYGTIPEGEDELPTHAWMIAFQGDLAVAVFVADGEAGSSVAGPIVESFLRSVGESGVTG